MKFSYKTSLAVSLTALLSACGTIPTSTMAEPATFASVDSGDTAMVAMNVMGQRCENTIIKLRDVNTNEPQSINIVQTGAKSTFGLRIGEPAFAALPAGTYQFLSGTCMNRNFYPINYRWISRWFEPFEIKDGDVRYLGTLAVSATSAKGKQTTTDEVVTRLLSMGFNQNKPVQFPMYRFMNLRSQVKTALRQNSPELVDKMTYDPPEPKFSQGEFTEAVREAFKPDENGKIPLKKDASQKVSEYMEQYKD